MRRLILSIICIAALSAPAAAWGPLAHEKLCEKAVETVWGKEALLCLADQVRYCLDLKAIVNDSVGQECLDAYAADIGVDPATAPATLFNDVEYHYSYDNCPLKWMRANEDFICSGTGSPARDKTVFWFQAAKGTDDVCRQVRSFCTGAFYYTSSFYPLNQVKYLTGCLNGPMDDLIDQEMMKNPDNWTVREQCVFAYMKPLAGVSRLTTQHVTFVVTDRDFKEVLGNLTVQAGYVRNPQFEPTTTTQAATTTTVQQAPTSTREAPTTTLQATPMTTTTETTTSTATTSTLPQTTTTDAMQTTMTTETTSTTSTTLQGMSSQVNQSLSEIETLLGNMSTMNSESTQQAKPRPYQNMVMVAALVTAVLLCLIMLVYLYSLMNRPSIHTSRKVILPPSLRRKMKQSK